MRLGLFKAQAAEKDLVEFIPCKRNATRDPGLERLGLFKAQAAEKALVEFIPCK
jgi:hypothetical protein